MEGEDSDQPLDTPLAKQPLQPRPLYMICECCQELKTYNETTKKLMNYILCSGPKIIWRVSVH